MFFLTKKRLLECKPEWNREAITVFSRLPSLRRLQATLPLQTSLGGAALAHLEFGVSEKRTEGETDSLLLLAPPPDLKI